MVKRYEVYCRCWDMAFNVQEERDGDWVRYKDYKRLEEALKEIVAAKREPHYGYIDTAWDHLSSAVEKHENLVA